MIIFTGSVAPCPDTTSLEVISKSYRRAGTLERAVQKTLGKYDDQNIIFIKTNTILIDLGGAA